MQSPGVPLSSPSSQVSGSVTIPSPQTAIGSGGTNKFTKVHSTVWPLKMLKFSVLPCEAPSIRQSDDISSQLSGTGISITE